ncbi:organic cation transporter protein-like isoform X2 [Palaemon carinicauda]
MNNVDGLDDFLTKLGTGKWNYLFFATSAAVPGVLPIYLIGSEFLNSVTSFSCAVPDDNRTLPLNGSQCEMVERDSTGHEQIVPCEEWIYDTSLFHSTVAMEWNLVCDKARLASLFQTIYTAGGFMGAMVAGMAADRYGRRWCIRTGTLFTICFTIALVFSPWFWLVVVARFFLGVFNTIMVGPAFIISMEICNPSLRPTVGIFLALPYALMMIGIAGIAYCIRDWRLLQAAASWPCLVILVLMYLIDKSPRWLIVKGRLDEAIIVLQRAVRLNQPNFALDVDVSSVVHSIYQKQNETKTQKTQNEQNESGTSLHLPSTKTQDSMSARGGTDPSLSRPPNALGLDDGIGPWWAAPVALLRTKIIRKMTLVLVTVWLLQGVVYLGLPLSSSSFSSPFLYMALLGAFEIPAYSLTAPITKRIGRKSVVTTCLMTSGALLLSVAGFLLYHITNEWLHIGIVMISYLLVCTAYQVNFLYAPELFPTTLRPLGSAACTLSAYVGFSIPPFITYYTYGNNLAWVSAAVFGSCAIVAGLLVFLLPETNGRNLAETVADLVNRLEEEENLQSNGNGTQPASHLTYGSDGDSFNKSRVSTISGTYCNAGYT